MKIRYWSYLLVVLVAGMIFSCSQEEDCRKNRNVTFGGTFYLDTLNEKTNKRIVSKLTIDSLWVRGIDVDSFLYKKAKTEIISIPLNQFAEESKFQMKFNTITDTITIRYKNKIEYLSLECGSVRTQDIDTVFSTNHYVDSISLKQPIVNTNYVENVQIFHIK